MILPWFPRDADRLIDDWKDVSAQNMTHWHWLRDLSLLEYLSIVSRRESTVICQQDSIVKISISNDKN